MPIEKNANGVPYNQKACECFGIRNAQNGSEANYYSVKEIFSMNSKFYTRTKEIGGKKYTAQFNGLSAAIQAIDNSYIEGTQNTSIEKLTKYILANVIVEPANLQIDDFETMEELNEVIRFGRSVMEGKFREEPKQVAKK